jgi:hypothetical protein
MDRMGCSSSDRRRKHTKIFVFNARGPRARWLSQEFRKTCLSKVLRKIKTPVGFPSPWNRKCGCACGCSPGFDVKNNKALDVFVQLW